MKKYRSPLEIATNILNACQDHTRLSAISRRANLSFASMRPYLERMVASGLLIKEATSEKTRFGISYSYKTTPKGQEFIKKVEDFKECWNF